MNKVMRYIAWSLGGKGYKREHSSDETALYRHKGNDPTYVHLFPIASPFFPNHAEVIFVKLNPHGQSTACSGWFTGKMEPADNYDAEKVREMLSRQFSY